MGIHGYRSTFYTFVKIGKFMTLRDGSVPIPAPGRLRLQKFLSSAVTSTRLGELDREITEI